MSEYKWDKEWEMYIWSDHFKGTPYVFGYDPVQKQTWYAVPGDGEVEWKFHADGNTAPKDIIAHAAANARAIYNRIEDERERERENGKPDWDGQGPDPLRGALPIGTNFEARRAQAQRDAYLYRLRVDKEKQDRAWQVAQYGEFGDHSWIHNGNAAQGYQGRTWPPGSGGQKRVRKSRRRNKSRKTKRIR